MKKLILSIALALFTMTTSAMAESIRIGTEGAYAPWNFLDDSGKLAGFEIDLGEALCAEAGLECKFVANEWDSIIPNLIAGNYDAIMAGMSITDERKQTINFSDEYHPADPSTFAALKGAKFDFNNLKGHKIGVQGATIHAAYAEANLAANNKILSFETGDQSVADLAAGNIDLLLADGTFIDPIIEASKGGMVAVGPHPIIGGGVGIGLRKKDAGLAAKLNKALAALKANGTVDKLIKDYFKKGPFYTN